jgi:hypothetical protein
MLTINSVIKWFINNIKRYSTVPNLATFATRKPRNVNGNTIATFIAAQHTSVSYLLAFNNLKVKTRSSSIILMQFFPLLIINYTAFRQRGNGTFTVERVASFSPRLPCPSPPAKVLSFGDSLTSVSLHAHIYKNTVKR